MPRKKFALDLELKEIMDKLLTNKTIQIGVFYLLVSGTRQLLETPQVTEEKIREVPTAVEQFWRTFAKGWLEGIGLAPLSETVSELGAVAFTSPFSALELALLAAIPLSAMESGSLPIQLGSILTKVAAT